MAIVIDVESELRSLVLDTKNIINNLDAGNHQEIRDICEVHMFVCMVLSFDFVL
jgi:hypothetical protein